MRRRLRRLTAEIAAQELLERRGRKRFVVFVGRGELAFFGVFDRHRHIDDGRENLFHDRVQALQRNPRIALELAEFRRLALRLRRRVGSESHGQE